MSKVLVIAEYHHDEITLGTKATINAALKLAQHCDVLVVCAMDTVSPTLAKLQGVHKVKVLTDPCFSHLLGEDVAQCIVSIAKEYTHILAPSSTFGKNFLPRVAAMLDVAQISDVIAIESEAIFVRPIYAGNAFEKVQSLDPIKILTIRTTAFEPVAQSLTTANITPINSAFESTSQVQFKHQETPTLTRPELTAAKVIVSGGRGFKSKDNFKMLESLAEKLGAAVGASRAAVDAGFVPNDFQVGQTGKVVAPNLYIAIGISGAIQHLAGMKDSKVIVAINKDPEASIFQVADYGLVGDLFTLVPELEKALGS